METRDYEKWKSSVVTSNQQNKTEGINNPCIFFLLLKSQGFMMVDPRFPFHFL